MLLVLAMMVEFITPVCIVSGWYDGFAAFVLAGYCVITAILYHNFWKYRHFWSPGSEGYPHLWDFLKNFGLVGGLVFDRHLVNSANPPLRWFCIDASALDDVDFTASLRVIFASLKGKGVRLVVARVMADVAAESRCRLWRLLR